MLPISWMVHTVSFKRRSGVNAADGTPAYANGMQTLQARVERKTRLMRGKDGKEIAVSSSFTSLTKVLYDDTIWLPSVGGEPADDTSSADNARTPDAIETATNKAGVEVMWLVGFV